MDAANGWLYLHLGLRARVAGTVTLDIAGADIKHEVYFDDIEAIHQQGMIVQEQHLYPYGSPLTGLNYVVDGRRYRHGYQGQFAEKDQGNGVG